MLIGPVILWPVENDSDWIFPRWISEYSDLKSQQCSCLARLEDIHVLTRTCTHSSVYFFRCQDGNLYPLSRYTQGSLKRFLTALVWKCATKKFQFRMLSIPTLLYFCLHHTVQMKSILTANKLFFFFVVYATSCSHEKCCTVRYSAVRTKFGVFLSWCSSPLFQEIVMNVVSLISFSENVPHRFIDHRKFFSPLI